MRTIYIFRSRNSSRNRFGNSYPSKRYDPNYWYNAGGIIGLVLQFLAGAGIGYVVGSVVRGVFRAICILM